MSLRGRPDPLEEKRRIWCQPGNALGRIEAVTNTIVKAIARELPEGGALTTKEAARRGGLRSLRRCDRFRAAWTEGTAAINVATRVCDLLNDLQDRDGPRLREKAARLERQGFAVQFGIYHEPILREENPHEGTEVTLMIFAGRPSAPSPG